MRDAEAESAGWSTSLPRSARRAPRRTFRREPRSRSLLVSPSSGVRPSGRVGRHVEAPGPPLRDRLTERRRRAPSSSSSARQLAALPLEGIVDLAAELARLKRKFRGSTGLAKIDAKLGNADFLSARAGGGRRGAARAQGRGATAQAQGRRRPVTLASGLRASGFEAGSHFSGDPMLQSSCWRVGRSGKPGPRSVDAPEPDPEKLQTFRTGSCGQTTF